MGIGAAILVLAGLVPRVALAQSDADRATARALARDGYEAQKRGQYDVAADRFRRAEDLVHAPTLLLGLARAEVGLGKLVEARELYERILHEPLALGAPPPFVKAVEDAKREGPAVAARLAWVTLDIQGPLSADIVMDGLAVPSAALGVKRACDPGEHVVKVTASGYLPAEKTFSIAEGGAQAITMTMSRAPMPPSPPPTDQVAEAPSEENPGQPSTAQKTIGFTVLGIGAAGLIVGGVTGGLVLAKHASLDGSCPAGHCSPDKSGQVDTYRTLANVSTVATIVGAVGAVTGITLLLTAPKSPPVTAYANVFSAGIQGSF